MTPSHSKWLVCLAALCVACTSKDTTTTNPVELTLPATFILASGDSQIATGSATLAAPLIVRVVDVKNRGISGVPVLWSVSDADAKVSAAATTTDGTGQTQVQWTLGDSPGRQTVTATTPRLPGAEVVFQASNGASISGGVTLANVPLTTITPSSSLLRGGATLSAMRVGASAKTAAAGGAGNHSVWERSKSAAQLLAAGAPTRRLIVEFKPKAMGMTAHIATTGGAAMQAIVGAMSQSLASFSTAGLVMSPEYSPVILATRVTVPPSADIDAAIVALRASSDVESVTVDEIVPMLDDYAATELVPLSKPGTAAAAAASGPIAGAVPGILPNDPLLPAEYWHYNMIDLPRAWATATGSANVLVAVVDNGIRFTHPAISANLTNDGYNFVTGGNRLTVAQPLCSGGTTLVPEAGYGPDPTEPDDLAFTGTCWLRSTLGNHGLHVAGTIGAVGNDGVGTTGVNWTVRIRPVRTLDITGSGSYFDIAQGVLYAAGLAASDGNGGTVTAPSRAAIINMSLGGSSPGTVLQNAVTAANTAGTLIVAAAGNNESNGPFYPASYPEVLSVVALGPDLQLASYSNVGGTVSLAAPGGSFRFSGTSGVASSTWNFVTGSPNYAYYQGTSMASPHVAGVAALVLGANPGMTNAQLRARLQNTAIDLGPPGRDDRFGYGLVNAYNALNNVTAPRRDAYVRVVDAVMGTTVRTVAVRADGSYVVPRLAAGSYYVFAGQDENTDHITGMPGRRWGWYGGASGPAIIVLGASQNAIASINSGLPVETEPNNNTAQANRLPINGYITGQVSASDLADMYVVTIPTAGTYYFETTGLLGSCGYGLELDTVLTLLDSFGNTLATNDDTVFPSSQFCSAISRAMTPGTYYLTVTGALGAQGQYRLWARDTP